MDRQRRVIWHGVFLFLMGLLTGLVEQHFANPRMGLAAHLEGVMNGTVLIALGAVWPMIRLTPRLSNGLYGTLLYGTYANWLVVTLAAIAGTRAMSPLTGTAQGAETWKEIAVTLGFVSVGIAMIAAFVLLLWGLGRNAAASV
ncbi:MAG: hydrogenase [Afipia sp.]|nr:hydrogenase [Afipia sp.]